jgi:23S rRNA pseudouridine1911/1915/1917 synthase
VHGSLVILHEDSDCLAVAKPAGQFTQGSWAPAGEMTLEQSVRRHLDPLNPSSVYLGIVHRLDRPTSGVLIWAKTPKAARRLSSQFERRRVLKEYWAIVTIERPPAESASATGGGLPDDRGVETTWCDWLTRTSDSESGVACAVGPDVSGARQAVTRVRRDQAMALPPDCTWLRLWPQTGRTHQLRAQAAVRGLPILGDAQYGSTVPFGAGNRIALHARTLQLRHPMIQTELRLVAPLPAEWGLQGIMLPAGG